MSSTNGQGAEDVEVGGLEGIVYGVEPDLAVAEFEMILRRSGLAERRPVERLDVLERMLRGADVVLTARLAAEGKGRGRLVGVARAISDFAYCTYVSDLAVDAGFQRRGIGRRLLRMMHEVAGLHTTLLLVAAPGARDYYPAVGMRHQDACWTFPRSAAPVPLPESGKGGR